jgi:hypothetical protein
METLTQKMAIVLKREPKAKIDSDRFHLVFSQVAPELNTDQARRRRLRETLDELAKQGVIALPATTKASWTSLPTPPLPNWIRVVRPLAPKAERFDHKGFPWVAQLQFIPEMERLKSTVEALKIHEFLKRNPDAPIVPIKERSWQIFGDEKRLETILDSQLFGTNRLSEEILRCRTVSLSLLYHSLTNPISGPPLIVENESSFHSFTRLNAQKHLYSATIYGAGQAVLKAGGFLQELAQSFKCNQFLYFGDLDRRGLGIAHDLNQAMQKVGISIKPAEELYHRMLEISSPIQGVSIDAPKSHLSWLPVTLQVSVEARLRTHGRVAQEALGWERLCELFGADPNGEFSLGFVPR